MRTLIISSILLLSTSICNAQWVQTNGPYGGMVNAFAVWSNGADSTNLYATCQEGVFLSTNDGTNWTALGSRSMGAWALAISPNGAGGTALFAGTARGAFVLTNGSTWTKVRGGLPSDIPIRAFAINGTNLFAGTSQGVYLSTDSGTSWVLSDSGLTITDIRSLAVSGTNLFAAYGGVYLSTNNGISWTAVNNGLSLTAIGHVTSLSASDTNLFAGTYSSGVFLTTNNGTSWTAMNSGLPRRTLVYALAVSPNGAGGTNLFAGTDYGVFLSSNNGINWTLVDTENIRAFAVTSTHDIPHIFAGMQSRGVLRSTDNGSIWNEVNDGLAGIDVESFLKSDTNLYAGTSNGVFLNTNNGIDWAEVADIGFVTALAVAPNGSGGTNLFAGIYAADEVYLSTDNGTSWKEADSGLTASIITALTVIGMNLFAGTERGVFLSTNSGTSWIMVNNGLPEYSYIRALAVSDTNLFAGTMDGVFLSTNNGTSWVEIDSGLTDNDIEALAVSGGNLFGGNGEGAYLSTNNGISWTTINSGLPWDEIIAFVVSGVNLFAGTYNSGVFLTTNNGASWTGVNSGLNCTNVVALGVSGTDLFAATGRGTWMRPLSEMIVGPVEYPFTHNWNLISIPRHVSDYRKSSLFPTAISGAFAYNGTYIQKDTLAGGSGYWLRFDHDQMITLSGYPIYGDTFDVVEGWNLVGSISYPVATASITSDTPAMITSNFFGYNAGYYTTDTIRPGKGYWVKVSQGGKLILSSPSSARVLANNQIRIVPTSDLPPLPPVESEGLKTILPKDYALAEAYPSPFNPTTTISYELPMQSRVSLRIYDLLGQLISTLVDRIQAAGYEQISWNASRFPSGIYFYRLDAVSVSDPSKSFTSVKKMVLIR